MLRGVKGAVFMVLALVACSGAPPTVPATSVAPSAPKVPAPAVHGKVLSETGQPLPLAHVAVLGADGKPGDRHEVGHDGSFSLPRAASSSLIRIRISGAAHRTEMLVVAPEDGDVAVTVKLGAPAPHGEATPIVVLYKDKEPKSQRMTRGADGTFSTDVEVPDGRYPYIIAGVLNDGLSGNPVDGYELSERGTYRPQIVVKGGKAHITFDPKALHESFSSFEFANPGAVSAELTKIALRLAQAEQKVDALVEELLHAKGGPPLDVTQRIQSASKAELLVVRKDLAALVKTSKIDVVRRAAMVAYFSGEQIESPTEEEKELAKRVHEEVPADSALWALFRSFNGVRNTLGNDAPDAIAYSKEFLAKQADDNAVSTFLFERLIGTKDESQRRALVAELRKPRFDGSAEQQQADGYDPDRKLTAGKDVAFEVKSLTGAKVTPKDLAGKVFLIDVWGTWCAPCVAELPGIHELYKKFGGAPSGGRTKRFDVLSIALENDAAPVKKFREDKAHPMPWQHGLGDPDTFLEAFGGKGLGVPLYVLVDEKGKIIASSPDLHATMLPELLERVLR